MDLISWLYWAQHQMLLHTWPADMWASMLILCGDSPLSRPINRNQSRCQTWNHFTNCSQFFFFCWRSRVQWTMIETSVKRAALMAVTQDPCFYLFWLILSISAWLNNASPAACDVDTAKPAFDILAKWVKRQHTGWGRGGREERGLEVG